MGSRRNVGSFVWGFAFAGALLFVVVRLRTKKAAVVPVAAALVVNMEQSDVHIVCGMRTLEATDV